MRRSGTDLEDDVVDLLDLLLGQDDVGGREVLGQVLFALGARDREDVVTLSEDPGERDLSWRAALPVGDLATREGGTDGQRES